ncbi:hypothetical protein AHF37_00328, partial [Paragonimus kellicotti]
KRNEISWSSEVDKSRDAESKLSDLANKLSTTKQELATIKENELRQRESFQSVLKSFGVKLQNLRQSNSQLQYMHKNEIQTNVRNLCQLRKHTSKRIQAIHTRLIPSFIQELTKSLTTLIREKVEKELSQRAEGAQSSEKRLEAELARYRKLIQTTKQEQEQSNENSRRKMIEMENEWNRQKEDYITKLRDSELAREKIMLDATAQQTQTEATSTKLIEFAQEIDRLEKKNEQLAKRVKVTRFFLSGLMK